MTDVLEEQTAASGRTKTLKRTRAALDPDSLSGFSSSLLNKDGFLNPNTRPQSHLFSISKAVNPLVAAASPLFTLATQIQALPSCPDITVLKEQLIHEANAFEGKAQSLGYRPQMILAARYLVCTLLDETIENTSWGRHTQWKKNNLLKFFHHHTTGGKRVFMILERSLKDPVLYLDLIELGYMCLSLGLEGKRKHEEIVKWMNELYGIIRQERGEISRQLLLAPPEESLQPSSKWRLPPIGVIITLTLGVLTAIYFPYQHHLQHLTRDVDNTLKILDTYGKETR
ncbi:MAG TPA: type IVB secretion system protein IcmH/DotU [Coxiellaceae bacterium]|nr:type IVB secretion system protein IcmH/DotU [Coxiellaceae bacterium]